MKRSILSLVLVLLAAAPARAHFIWIVPDEKGTGARVIFSENLEPDNPKLLARIGKTEVFVLAAGGKRTLLQWTAAKDAFQVTAPDKAGTLAASYTYGVIEKGKEGPFLLKYTATASLKPERTFGGFNAIADPWDRQGLGLRYEGNSGGFMLFEVLWQGKRLPNAEVVVWRPGLVQARELKADQRGFVDVGEHEQHLKPGLYGIRVRHVEAKEGEHEGKKYKEIRHYATLVYRVAAPQAGKARPAPKEDPAASLLLKEARAARARWENFPGFSADAAVNFNGKVSRGKVVVDATGKVRFENIDKEMETWARRNLASTVAHRLDDSAGRNTPCAFFDDNKDHPLGRAIRVLNDELHSSYRIKDRQIVEVNRQMKEGRFSISVLENRPNAEGKFLSVAFVVNFWDLTNGSLQRTEAHHQTWTRVGRFDLPAMTTVVTGTPETGAAGSGKNAQSLTLSKHQLLDAAGR